MKKSAHWYSRGEIAYDKGWLEENCDDVQKKKE